MSQSKNKTETTSEEVTEPVESVKPVEASQKQNEPMVILSKTDAYIHERLKSQPKTLEEVEIKASQERPSDMHRMSLPDEIKEHENKFAFRWLFKNPRAIAEACDQKGWTLLTRGFPGFENVPKHLFTTNGVMERGDNILAFMPKKMAEELRKIPGKLSKDRVENMIGRHSNNPNFYKPSDSEDKNVIMI